ncbi:hypothetical protein B0H19DRAFT_143265 [Mycena capillaripes]|nr:hypothetical protein B0H19DRAFT_143265 [Mycena capillaripes]
MAVGEGAFQREEGRYHRPTSLYNHFLPHINYYPMIWDGHPGTPRRRYVCADFAVLRRQHRHTSYQLETHHPGASNFDEALCRSKTIHICVLQGSNKGQRDGNGIRGAMTISFIGHFAQTRMKLGTNTFLVGHRTSSFTVHFPVLLCHRLTPITCCEYLQNSRQRRSSGIRRSAPTCPFEVCEAFRRSYYDHASSYINKMRTARYICGPICLTHLFCRMGDIS